MVWNFEIEERNLMEKSKVARVFSKKAIVISGLVGLVIGIVLMMPIAHLYAHCAVWSLYNLVPSHVYGLVQICLVIFPWFWGSAG